MRRAPVCYKVKKTLGEKVANASSTSAADKSKALLQLIRIDPSTNTKRIDSYEFVKNQDFMVLDLLTAIKAHQDPSLAFRASCCEGVCGSCAMNINGINSMACVTFAQQVTTVGPLPNFPVLKDMVVDLRGFFKQYEYIRPFVRNINLGRYHASSIVGRYQETCKALYGSSDSPATKASKAIAGNSETAIGASPLALYSTVLDKVVSVGDTSKVVDILTKLKGQGYKLDNAWVKSVIKESIGNHAK